jgi:5,10-methylenetetrahydromethanopterin reductase
VASPEFGIGLRGDLDFAEYARRGRAAERLGFDVVTAFGDLAFAPPFPILLAIAGVTERVRLGPSCVNPYTSHPVEIAGQVAMLDAASAGRAYLGLARGAWLESIGLDQPRPLRAIRETWEITRRLLRGDRSGYLGELFTLAPGLALQQPIQRPEVPLLIGTWGERTAALAGEIARELKVGGSANPDLVPLMRRRLRVPADVTGIVLGAVTVVDSDREAARQRARSMVAMYFDVVAQHDPTLDLPRHLLNQVGDALRAGDSTAAGRLIPEHMLDRFAFAGTPADVVARCRELFDAGVKRVEFGVPLGLTTDEGLRLLGDRVLPEFR